MNQMLKKASSVCAAAVCAASLMFSGASVVMAGSEIDEEIMTQITMTAEGLTQTIIPLSDEEIEAYLESGDEFTEGAMTAWDDARDEVGELNEETFSWLREQLKRPKIVAVGEIGLDYYWDKEKRELQKEWFVRQLRLARELKKPVVIHSREAAADTMEILKAEVTDEIFYEMHCYSYSPEMAREYLKMGFYLGIGGVLTFKNAKKLKEVAEEAPIEKLLLETDCPYLAPVPNRGKRNDSRNIRYVAEELAKIKGMTTEEVIRITEKNAKRFYRISEENA